MKHTLICTLLLSTLAFSAVATQRTNNSSPSDPGVVNQERILYWLEKRGQLAANADAKTKKVALENYLNKKSFEKKLLPGILGKQLQKAERLKAKSLKIIQKGNSKVAALSTSAASNDIETTVKVLAIMIDFPDLEHDDNGLTASDTDMYYSDYSVQHYNDLLFSENGFSGPSGQNIISSYQYYQQESGGTFFFTGQAHNWVTADNDAKYYGENDADNNFDDKNVPALVLEAVTKAVENGVDLTEYDQVDTYDFDNDGVLNEPDGIIDHVMIFHSSIGEEAGGGVLAENAIWSHRFYVVNDNPNETGVAIPNSSVRLFGYTINPIDAATGVTVHEFGHDLGLDDEYDTDNGALGSPVGNWSVMASGSWLGSPGGTSPATFSALARDYLSERYQGNWINQLEVDFAALASEDINLVAANNHQSGINQVKVNLPPKQIDFGVPVQGDYQYYSGKANEQDTRLSFDVSLPSEAATLTMTARWNIETDWDYVQVLVDGVAIAGSHTKTTNEFRPTITDFLTGDSADLNDAYGELSWVDINFDLTTYANQNVTIELLYKTDEYELGYGFVTDKVSVTANANELFFSGAENADEVQLNGFSRISDKFSGKNHNYYIQLRDYSGTDAKLEDIGYEPGVLLWYRDENVNDNQVNNHPGEVFIGVVDADQNLIKSGQSNRGTGSQIRDAAFSLYDQSTMSGDNSLTSNPLFSDGDDYSSPSQPESGINLPYLGLTMSVISQSTDSSSATITLTSTDTARIEVVQTGLSVTLTVQDDELLANTEITWSMGDGTQLTGKTITHSYAAAGAKSVTATYMIGADQKLLEKQFIVADTITGTINTTIVGKEVTFSASLAGGYGEMIYRWDFGDGSGKSITSNPSYSYDDYGTYTVLLTVTDETQQSSVLTVSVAIINQLMASISSTRNNLLVNFQSSVTGGDESYSYQWDFGDGSTASVSSPSHTYAQAGNYKVTLVVTDGKGAVVETSVNISVSAPVVTQPKPNTASSSGGGSFGLLTLFSLLFLRVFTRKSLRI